MFRVVLYQPEIPPNTGNIARLCLGTQSELHLIEPLGFSLDEKQLRRAGLDYWEKTDVHLHSSWEAFERVREPRVTMWCLSTKARHAYWEVQFQQGDYLLFGRETRGLPENLLEKYQESALTIPMQSEHIRSLNLATSVGIVLYEAIRQNSLSGNPLSS